MKKLKIISLLCLLGSLFVSIDLGLNFLFTLIPELQDGIGSHSILQGLFGILGDSGWSKAKFYFMFEKSVWLTFMLLIENIILHFINKKVK